MVFHDFNSLEEMHVEITNRCNAACPMCARNIFGGAEKPELVATEWVKDDAEKVFSNKFLNLQNILFCGTYGDPAVAKEALSLVETAKRLNGVTVEFYSNGSVRNASWWQDLGHLLNQKVSRSSSKYRDHDLCVFSIDGLEDTNHLYRRKTQFNKIIENANAFIKAGGKARWDFLVFKHNEHQVEEAENLSKKMGFAQFRIRKTSRFANSPDGPEKHRVLNSKNEIEYYIEPPSQAQYLNREKKNFEEVVRKDRLRQLDMNTPIACLKKTQFQRIYISASLNVWPCCFISNDAMEAQTKFYRELQSKVIQRYEPGFNSLKTQTWDEILNHPWFKNDLVKSWSDPESKLNRCQRTCGLGVNPIISQSEDRFKETMNSATNESFEL